MHRALNLNAMEFRPAAAVAATSSSLQSSECAGHTFAIDSPLLTPNKNVSVMPMSGATMWKVPLLTTQSPMLMDVSTEHEQIAPAVPYAAEDDLVRSIYFVPVVRALVECRAVFYQHSEAPRWKHLNFEQLVRSCFFEAHELNHLSVSATSTCGQHRPFWKAYSMEHFVAAHDVIMDFEGVAIEQGLTSSSSAEVPDGKVEKSSLNKNETLKKKKKESDTIDYYFKSSYMDDQEQGWRKKKLYERLSNMYQKHVQLIVPDSLRVLLAARARRAGAASSSVICDAIKYALDILYFFTRIQTLPSPEEFDGISYSSSVQFLTQLRERLLRPNVADAFLQVALVLMLISADHLPVALRVAEAANGTGVETRLQAQAMFCASFPTLIVAFLTSSPMQSIEELHHALSMPNHEECLPVLRSCVTGVMTIDKLFSYNTKTASLWSVTLGDAVNFTRHYLNKTNRHSRMGCNGVNSNVPVLRSELPCLLTKSSFNEMCLHTDSTSVINCLLQSSVGGKDLSNKSLRSMQYVQKQKSSGENKGNGVFPNAHERRAIPPLLNQFQFQTMNSAALSPTCRDETVYFCLMALANVESRDPSNLQRLFAALDEVYGALDRPGAADAMAYLSSPSACAGMSPIARELLDVVRELMRSTEPSHVKAFTEAQTAVGKRLQLPLFRTQGF